MAEKDSVYKCDICGNIVSVVDANEGILVCCGENMTLLNAKGKEKEGNEKHVPVIEGNLIKVGSIPHPMENDHYIELIQLFVDNILVLEKRLKPLQKPELIIPQEYMGKKITAKELCNKHGLWKSN